MPRYWQRSAQRRLQLAEPIGVGVLGTGIMGRRMLAALKRQDRFAAVALWDPSAAALQEALLLAPTARVASDVSALVQDPAVQLVYVASPPALHAAGVGAALAAGRACLCEKPLVHTTAEANALVELVRKAGLPFAVNFPFASSSSARRFQSIVTSGELGEITHAEIRVRFARWPRDWQAGASSWLAGSAEGGFTREVLSHFVFLSLRCLGPAQVQAVRLQRLPGQSETALQCQLVHDNCTVHIDGAVSGELADDNAFSVVGTKGSVTLSGWSTLSYRDERTEQVDGTANLWLALEACLQGGGQLGLATVQEAAAVVDCIESMLA